MKKMLSFLLIMIFAAIMLAGCNFTSQNNSLDTSASDGVYTEDIPGYTDYNANNTLKVVATNSIVADLVMNIGGDIIEVYSIVPVGTNPHEYEPLPADIQACGEAEIIFYNGLNLETGNGWFNKLMETTGKAEGSNYYAVSEGVISQYLTTSGNEGEEDPHAWLDIGNGIIYVKNITRILSEHDSTNKEIYEANAAEYIEMLTQLDQKAKGKFDDIPEEKKLLVTSEGAFKYFSKAYGLTAEYIWEINTENQGTPDQMKYIIDKINQSDVPVIFVETSVDPRSMEQVSSETKTPIYCAVFTDSLGDKGEEGDTYYSMMKWNLDKIHEGLSA